MTQVKEWSNQELNRKLAELMGYSVVDENPEFWRSTHYWVLVEPAEGRQQLGRGTEAEAWEDAPDYCTDPAASLEVQTAAIKADARKYGINLAKRLEWEEDDLEYSDNDVFSYTGVTVFLTATPRERAEAAYITLQGVKDHE